MSLPSLAHCVVWLSVVLAVLTDGHAVAAAAPRHGRGSQANSVSSPSSRPAPSGYIGIHDPSGVVWDEESSSYYVFGTGLTSHVSKDGYTWTKGIVPLTSTPDWVKTYVPLHSGGMWAPDIVLINGLWHLYYATSTWSGPVSCIGVATSPSLSHPNWTDSGSPVLCNVWEWTSRWTINAIDPHLFIDPRTHRRYLSFGSFHAGVYIVELNGDPIVSNVISDYHNVQRRIGDFAEGAEASWVQPTPYGGFALLGNWGLCCSGVASTYNIRVGISTEPLGPYLDREGLDMRFNGGTVLLNVSGRQIGPGQIGFPNPSPAGGPGGDMNAPIVSYHYYDGASSPPGTPTLGQAQLVWDEQGWPTVRDRM